MNRYARDKNDAFRPAPVKRINMDIKNTKVRIALVAFFLALAVVSFGYFGMKALSQEPGWKEITVQSEDGNTVAPEFSLLYNLGYSGISATAENKALTMEYTELTENAYKIFSAYESFEGVGNLYTLSKNPNQAVTVDPALYHALELIETYENRGIFLAPVYQEYHNLFFCANDAEAESFDPFVNPDQAAMLREICAFANDCRHIWLELQGDNQVKLCVSEAYLTYAKENGIELFLDLYWMKNAFVADYLADQLTEKGYVLGTLSSFDGYCRVMDPTDTAYSTDILDYAGGGTYKAAILQLRGPVATVSLHTYDLRGSAEKRYYKTEAGELRFPYIDPADGLCKAAMNDVVTYTENGSCAQTLLRTVQFFLREEPEDYGLTSFFADGGTHTVYCKDHEILYTQEGAEFTEVFTSEPLSYTPRREYEQLIY